MRRSTGVLDEHAITHVIHLAALLIPQIKATRRYGTAVNVGGTVNVLDAAKTRSIRVAYASSAAVYSQADDHGGPVPNDAIGHPTTFYGVHKQACEGLARIFWEEERVAVDRHPPVHRLRPRPRLRADRVAEPRDGRRCSRRELARSHSAAVRSSSSRRTRRASSSPRHALPSRAPASSSLGGPAVAVADAARAIEAVADVSCTVDEATLLPFPDEFDNGTLEDTVGPINWTPLEEGVRLTIDRLRAAPD